MEVEREWSVVVADDHGIVREGIAAFLKSRRNVRIVAQCSDGEEALREILDHRPDFAVLDSGLPRKSALEVVRNVGESGCRTRCIVMSINHDRTLIAEFLRNGVSAYLLKDGPAEELEEAMQCALAGGQYLSASLRIPESAASAASPNPMEVLSRREYEVFVLLADGIRPRDVAKQLEISAKTVDTYRANILRKLNLDGIAGLIRFAVQRGQSESSSQPVQG